MNPKIPVNQVVLRLNRDDLAVIADLLLTHGENAIAAKCIAATSPKASWRQYWDALSGETWGVYCARDVEEGATVFVQRRSDGQVQEVCVGKIVEDNPRSKSVLRAVNKSKAALSK
jgi:hypothetical protein